MGVGLMDNRVCMFYVVERLNDILKDKHLKKSLEGFKRECLYNLGVNAFHNHEIGAEHD
jgi:hypothetical protein